MIDKVAASVAGGLGHVRDGSVVLIGGFGTAGILGKLIDAVEGLARAELEKPGLEFVA